MPKVSIITAAYNHVRFIRQSIESAQSQTYKDFEHIVVDDGSSDGTADILKSFGDRITYIRQENRGAHAAINRGIRESSGEYIAILDRLVRIALEEKRDLVAEIWATNEGSVALHEKAGFKLESRRTKGGEEIRRYLLSVDMVTREQGNSVDRSRVVA